MIKIALTLCIVTSAMVIALTSCVNDTAKYSMYNDSPSFSNNGQEQSYHAAHETTNNLLQTPASEDTTLTSEDVTPAFLEEVQPCIENENETGYQIEMVLFEERDIKVQYPQIRGYKENELEALVNTDIEHMAFEEYYEYSSVELLEKLFLSVSGTVTFKGKEILCIRFTLYRYVGGSPYSVGFAYTSTYDLKNGERLGINDFLERSDRFVGIFRDYAKAIAVGGNCEDEVLAHAFSRVIFEDIVNNRFYTDSELLLMIFGNDESGKHGAELYFTDNKLRLLFYVDRKAGSSIEMEISLDAIPTNLLRIYPI